MRILLPTVVLSIACGAAAQQEAKLQVSFEDAFPAQETFDRPVLLASHPSDGDHVYVLTQPGHVFRIPRDGSDNKRQVFLDWTARCLAQPAFMDASNGAGWEEGLLGFAFDPRFPKERYVYIYYTEKTGEKEGRRGRKVPIRGSVLSRLTVVDGAAGPVAEPASELRILEVPQPYGNHNGGTIVFGPDRMLYVVLGDGGAANDPHGNGQNLGTLLATILRIDVLGATAAEPYGIPDDNPFVGTEGARGEIWAYGLRNPWRISFDRKTGALWCGDVGQNRFEEVDIIVKGRNYGWNHREGFEAFDRRRQKSPAPEGMIDPVTVYPRQDGVSITGGHVYRGAALPALQGRYVYGDFQSMRVWAVKVAEGGESDVIEIGRAPGPLASFAEQANGELLVLCFDGRIYRIE